MIAANLRAIVGAMTDRPWAFEGLDLRSPCRYRVLRISGFEANGDVEAIVALANHADALVGLVEAVRAWKLAGESLPDDIEAALACVEAIKCDS